MVLRSWALQKKLFPSSHKAVFYLWNLLVFHTDILSFSLPVHIIWGNAMSGTIYQSVSCSHISLAHRTQLAQHAPGNRNPCHAERLMQRDPPDSIFLCYQWRSPESRTSIWKSKSAWSSSFCSWKRAGCWSTPPAAPASLFPLQLSPIHLPQSLLLFCNLRWSFCPCLWNQSVCFSKEAETLLFYWGLWLLWGSKHECISGIAVSLCLQRNYNVVKDTARHQGGRVKANIEGRLQNECWVPALTWGTVPEAGMWTVRVYYWQSKKCQASGRWWQSSSCPVLSVRPSAFIGSLQPVDNSATRLPADVMGEDWSFLVISVWIVPTHISAGFELTVPNSSAPKPAASSF